MVQKKPYIEHMNEFQPFACSDFLIPLLTKLCPDEEKLDRYNDDEFLFFCVKTYFDGYK